MTSKLTRMLRYRAPAWHAEAARLREEVAKKIQGRQASELQSGQLDERVAELEGIASRLRHGAYAMASTQEQLTTALEREQKRTSALEATVRQLQDELTRQAGEHEIARLNLEQNLDRVRLAASEARDMAGIAQHEARCHHHCSSEA
jgi:TolA-binding protein